MRRTTAIFLLPLATLAACATGGGQGINSPLRSGYEAEESAVSARPLRVRLFDGAGSLSLELNRPAHTAIFEIIPGQGVAMVYPNMGQREFAMEGITYVSRNLSRQHFWGYDNIGRMPNRFASVMSGPRHLVVIASDRPLLTGRFRRSTGMLRRAMGTRSYTTLNSTRVVDDLLATIVPPQADASWDADVITVWPQTGGAPLPGGDLYRIRCPNGEVYWVPLELANAACRNPARVVEPPMRGDSTQPAQPTQPRDSTGVREPGGRRPLPDSVKSADPRVRMADGSYGKGVAGDPAARALRLADLRQALYTRRELFRSGGGNLSPRGRGETSNGYSTAGRTNEMPRSSGESYNGNSAAANGGERSIPQTTAGGQTRSGPPEVRPATP